MSATVGTGATEYAPVVGVIGGGQLARMMAPPATNLGITLRVLVESETGAAAQVIPTTRVGTPSDVRACQWAARGAQVLTFEHEHVSAEVLSDLADQGVALHPTPQALRHAQDKAVMRRAMERLGMPNPRWRQVGSMGEIAEFAREIDAAVVVKTARGGYDGKGVGFWDPHDRAPRGDSEAHLAKFADWFSSGEVLVEEKIDFAYELAVLVARSPSGEVRTWPVTQTIQAHGVCAQAIAPAPISPQVAQRARQIGTQVAAGLGVTGVLAVEMFVDRDDQLVINELAMRPHNSGHWTIDGAVTSQFENHLRAVLDLPLGDTEARAPACVMVNLLHCALPDPRLNYRQALAAYPQAKIHIYGKDPRPERKIGHVTVCADSVAQAQRIANDVVNILAGTNADTTDSDAGSTGVDDPKERG